MIRYILIFFIISIVAFACNNEEIDTTFPEIDMRFDDAFPMNCDTIYIGETFTFRAIFSDNVALGNYSIEVHNNFDHHAHSTEANVCDYDEDKTAVYPWNFIDQFDIPENIREYEAAINFFVPDDIDPGDYHFQIRLTDHEGWQALKGLSIKVLSK